MKFLTKPAMAMVGILAMLTLGACEHYSDDQTDVIDVSSNAAPTVTAASARLDAIPGVRPVPQFPVPNDRDLKVMTNKLSGGSVEIYDVDTGLPQNSGASVPPVQADYVGIPLATDPNVTIYPIDGYNTYPGEMGAPNVAGGQWPNAVLPMGNAGSGMTAAPASFGGDQPMAIEGGKLASREGGSVANIYFGYGSARLGGKDQAVLSSVAETAKFAPVDRISVEGHASAPTQTNDPVKSKILNLKESMNRAGAVSQELIEKGVPAEKIKTVSWGDTKPGSGGEAAQRRVDIYTGQ